VAATSVTLAAVVVVGNSERLRDTLDF